MITSSRIAKPVLVCSAIISLATQIEKRYFPYSLICTSMSRRFNYFPNSNYYCRCNFSKGIYLPHTQIPNFADFRGNKTHDLSFSGNTRFWFFEDTRIYFRTIFCSFSSNSELRTKTSNRISVIKKFLGSVSSPNGVRIKSVHKPVSVRVSVIVAVFARKKKQFSPKTDGKSSFEREISGGLKFLKKF